MGVQQSPSAPFRVKEGTATSSYNRGQGQPNPCQPDLKWEEASEFLM